MSNRYWIAGVVLLAASQVVFVYEEVSSGHTLRAVQMVLVVAALVCFFYGLSWSRGRRG
jgi:inner membrane protein involved in colicin E2 resistance